MRRLNRLERAINYFAFNFALYSVIIFLVLYFTKTTSVSGWVILKGALFFSLLCSFVKMLIEEASNEKH